MTGGLIAILITFIVVLGLSTSTVAYFVLQRHRADGAAMAQYRVLAEESVARQESLHRTLRELTDRLCAVEFMLRSVDEG
ncbi:MULTISPECIES: hypothetical protein [Streptomyces]|uniref:hypothetical protein n=1 Tax=Streptomyces TaxID=1883 RepID=UPI0005158931|nr:MULTISPECIES: hypothetical protein [Streptomyces]MCQ1582615.1 hypothetical protein [Streptomyces parvus]WDT89609.1 hypothetical protein H0E86_28685 [Streptomyces sp. SCSIO-PteL053]